MSLEGRETKASGERGEVDRMQDGDNELCMGFRDCDD